MITYHDNGVTQTNGRSKAKDKPTYSTAVTVVPEELEQSRKVKGERALMRSGFWCRMHSESDLDLTGDKPLNEFFEFNSCCP